MSQSGGECQTCNSSYGIFGDRQHIKRIEPSPQPSTPILGSKGQFCAAMYHVHDGGGRQYHCLDEGNCKIGIRVTENRENSSWPRSFQPKDVVALVKCEDESDEIIYEARYTNCYNGQKHAEDFMSEDTKFTEALNDPQVQKVTLYCTYQPCHYSVAPHTQGTPENWSCSKTLLEIFSEFLGSNHDKDIEKRQVFVKPTHLYKADRRNESDNANQAQIDKAKEGLNLLMRRPGGVQVTCLEQEDWDYLFKITEIPLAERPTYDDSSREKLDKNIGNFLASLRPA